MTRFLLDSGIVSDYINRRHRVHERARMEAAKGNPVGIALPVLAELVAGIERSNSRERNMRRLKTALPSLKLWPLDVTAAFEYGRVYAELARVGRPIGAIDMMIAAIALVLGDCTVVSADSDFGVVPGLSVENWRS
jgi:tRNA(fMet)-specific endonuclease VapC